MPRVRALFDVVGFHDGTEWRHAAKGEEFELDDEQLERHLALGSVEKVRASASAEKRKAPE